MSAASRPVRVLLYAADPVEEPEAVAEAYHRISTELAGTDGLRGNELMRSLTDPSGFVVMSEWESLEAFRAWEDGPTHRVTTAPLRPFQDRRRGSAFGLYEVAASY